MISSFSSFGAIINSKPSEIIGSEFYYTFDTADYHPTNITTHKNQITSAYDLTIQSNGIKDATTNITGTADLNMPGTSGNHATISSVSTGSTGITLSIWFRSNSTVNGTRIFDFGNGATNNNIELYLDSSNKPVFRIYNGATPFAYTGTSFIDVVMRTDNTYRHIGIVMNPNGTFKYYLNGGLYNTTTGNQYPNAVARTTNYIGLGSNALTTYLSGGIGEFRMYNTMKTDADMLSYYKSNTRIDNYTNMFCHYKFLSNDLIGNGSFPKILNHATGIYDLSFNRITLITQSTSGTDSNVGLASQDSKFVGSTYFYSYAPSNTATDNTYGANLPAIRTPSSNGITVCFWFKLVSTPVQWAILFGMNTQNGKNEANQATRIGIHVNTNQTGNPMVAAGNSNSIWPFLSSATSPSVLTTTWHFFHIRTNSTSDNVEQCLDMSTFSLTSPIPGQITKNITYNFIKLLCAPALDVPAYAQIDDFRLYNIGLTDSELRAIYTKTNKL
jgi:hypothetical protein